MQTKQSIITLVGAAILLLFALAVISFVPPAPMIHALSPSLEGESQPHVGFDTLDDFVAAGEYMNAGLLFASFPCIDNNNDDKCTYEDDFTTVTYRFDILQGAGADADNCEGQGLGMVRNFSRFILQFLENLKPYTSSYRQELSAQRLHDEVYGHLYRTRLGRGYPGCLQWYGLHSRFRATASDSHTHRHAHPDTPADATHLNAHTDRPHPPKRPYRQPRRPKRPRPQPRPHRPPRRLSKITGKTRRKRTQPRRPRLRLPPSPRPPRGSTVCPPPSIKASKLPST